MVNQLSPHVHTDIHVHGKYVYSTLALEKEREIVKEETALRNEKEAVCCNDVHVCVAGTVVSSAGIPVVICVGMSCTCTSMYACMYVCSCT